jgi:hypothetical protein
MKLLKNISSFKLVLKKGSSNPFRIFNSSIPLLTGIERYNGGGYSKRKKVASASEYN